MRRQVQEEGRRHGELKAQLSAQQAKVEQLVLRRRRLDEEVAELAEQRALEQEQPSEARLTLQEALDSMALDTERRETLLAERDALRERLDRIRQDARTHSDHAHQLAVRVGSLRAQHIPPSRLWSASTSSRRASTSVANSSTSIWRRVRRRWKSCA